MRLLRVSLLAGIYQSLIRPHRNGLLASLVILWIPANISQQAFSLIYIGAHANIRVIHISCMNGGSNVRLLVVGCQHDLFHRTPKLVGRTIIAAGQFTNSSIDVRLPPQEGGPVVEDVEVVCVVPLLLDYLQLNILVIQSLIKRFRAVLRESEARSEERRGGKEGR